MRCIVVSGVPGSGKTRYREENLGRLPHVDIKDIYDAVGDISWDAAVMAMLVKAGKLFQGGANTVVLEGVFLPGTPSRELLERELRDMRIDTEFILVHRSYKECQEGIRNSVGDVGIRMLILCRYWDRAEALVEEDSGDDN